MMIKQIQPFPVKEQASVLEYLLSLKKQFKEAHLNELFKADVARFKHFSVECDQIVFDFSKHRIDQNVLNSLIELAQAQDLNQWIKRLFSSEQINCTEQRAAMHWALRLPKSSSVVSSAGQDVHLQLERMNALVEKIHAGQYRGATGEVIQDVVNIGVGGSDLGPLMVTHALSDFKVKTAKPLADILFQRWMEASFLSYCISFDLRRLYLLFLQNRLVRLILCPMHKPCVNG